ncbi:hypothetical protein TZ02_01380 [Clostridium aceticum]|nr:hypothetical protein TZ02_01380 [Clostridium aceticum]
MTLLREIITDHTLRTVSMGAAILGITSGVLGTFAVLRKQSLLGDAISHSALPGIVIAFLLTSSKSSTVLLLGALIAGCLSAYCMMGIVNYSHIKYDGALGIILSVFFGFGLMLLSYAQKFPNARQAGLNKFLFGQAATLLRQDVITMGIFSAVALAVLIIFWKEFKLLSFNANYGMSLGFSMKAVDFLLTSLLVVGIVVGLQTVGVVLMSVMIIAPAVSARQWTDRLEIMAILSALFGALSGISGAVISSRVSKLPTGPTIVLVGFIIVMFSILFAPKRGILYQLWFRYENHGRISMEMTLEKLYILSKDTKDTFHPYAISLFNLTGEKYRQNKGRILKNLKNLEALGWVKHMEDHQWALTSEGLEEARKIHQEMGGDANA